MQNNIKGKKFLITIQRLSEYTGSEIQALELAEYLVAHGAKVTAFAYFIDRPMSADFEKIGVTTTTNLDGIALSSFDYLWICQQSFPQEFFTQINDLIKQQSLPHLIFLHQSPHTYVPNEFPYLYNLEETLASKILFNSEETLSAQTSHFKRQDNFALYPNPAPTAFCDFDFARRNQPLKQILVVSNHPPQEFIAAKLEAKGVKCTFSGAEQDLYQRITPEFLGKYDLVVTIGKTVQYCLCMGLPVYLYDRFGGDGFLTADNYSSCKKLNFSGRKYENAAYQDNFKSSDQISKDIINNFAARRAFYYQNRKQFIAEFSLDNVLPQILKTLKRPKLTQPFDPQYLLALSDTRRLMEFYSAQVCEEQKANQQAAAKLRAFQELQKQLKAQTAQINTFNTSKIYKTATALRNLSRKIRKLD